MTYRNGIKEYLLTGIIFGGIMGIYFAVMYGDVLLGAVSGLLSGAMFSFLIFLFIKIQERKFAKLRNEISKTKNVICDGGATLGGNGGWLFLTDDSLEFHAHKINFNRNSMVMPITAVMNVVAKYNKIIISADSGERFEIVVTHAKEWKVNIEKCLLEIS